MSVDDVRQLETAFNLLLENRQDPNYGVNAPKLVSMQVIELTLAGWQGR
jgi:hypothetical protein